MGKFFLMDMSIFSLEAVAEGKVKPQRKGEDSLVDAAVAGEGFMDAEEEEGPKESEEAFVGDADNREEGGAESIREEEVEWKPPSKNATLKQSYFKNFIMV